jgi:predicted TIM-barrel fold metal-dependent hydrolase
MTIPDDVTLIDAHTHTQPSRAATEAFMANLQMPAGRAGTTSEVVAGMDRTNVEWTMIVPWLPAQDFVDEAIAAGADRDEAVERVLGRWHELNSWAAAAAAAQPARLKSVIGLDPVLMSPERIEREVRTQLAAGASGVKVAPMFIGVPADDEKMEIIWRLAVEHDVPVLSESGGLSFGPHGAWGHPRHFEAVLRSYPSLRLQLAHLGQGAEDDMAKLLRQSETVITDTALRFGGMGGDDPDPAELAALIRQLGVDRVSFGTNYPIVDQGAYARALRALPLSAEELTQVGHDNAARLWRTPLLAGQRRGHPD